MSARIIPRCTCRQQRSLLAATTGLNPGQQRRWASSSADVKGKRRQRSGWQPGTQSSMHSIIREADKHLHAVIGLELHVQLKGNVKLLSPAKAVYDSTPNSSVATFDAALPGSLPQLGAEPVRLALLACLALKSNINPRSSFDRKHYFYPDLPAGYQVTQKYCTTVDQCIINHKFDVKDTAKSSHDPETGTTLVDLNRAGAALIEIVTRPDMKSSVQAAAFVRHLQAILRHVGASDANMEKGELRCDVNVSVQRVGSSESGTRCEIKNMNGVRFLAAAIESEIDRQITELEAGKQIEQATRGFNAVTGQTYHLRGKEDAPDYRFMPDPELGAIIVTKERLKKMRDELPELPDEAFDRLRKQYGLAAREASILVALGERLDDDRDQGESLAGVGVKYFEDVARGRDAQVAANWVIHELLGALSKAELTLAASPVTPQALGSLIDAVATNKLTGTTAKALVRSFIANPQGPSFSELISQSISSQPTSSDLDLICPQVINDLATESDKVRRGHSKVLMRLVGEVMKRTGGKANAQKAKQVLQDLLQS
ncbi:hypothetical protein OIV83_004061 [Microbotryomycetes sp. JL201]|nr:hypothetical protein OIV83_004061 [Microbotryomycetes sp. JL201]